MSEFLRHVGLLNRLKARELRNRVVSVTGWEWLKRSLFSLAGLALLVGLYIGFYRSLHYLETVELIGGLLTWKLTSMALLTTFWMVVISNLIAAISTLFYAFDLSFLLVKPVPPRAVFLMKSLEASVYASWMVALALVPYVLALAKVKALGAGFVLMVLGLSVPFLLLAASVGIFLTMCLLYAFPSSRTRDIVWILSSASMGVIYVVIRFAEPERLVRPDTLQQVVQYLQYLQAPTAPYLPSWWMTEALMGWAGGNRGMFWRNTGMIAGGAVAAYGLMTFLAAWMYLRGVSGAQEGRRRRAGWTAEPPLEVRLRREFGVSSLAPVLYWKDRTLFWRDVTHWSQLMLIFALVLVYLFSIQRLPLDTPHLKSLGAFLNIGAAGFVMAALGLRFTFPSISLEGKSFWVVRAAPLGVATLMAEKFMLSAIPMCVLGGGIVAVTNWLLAADVFIGWLTFFSMLMITLTLCGMGVGFGAIFPKFDVENIHQIESSAGGFAYMACALGYIGLMVALESWIVQNHFWIKFGKMPGWDWTLVGWTLGAVGVLNVAAFAVPWLVGRRLLENYEG